MNTHSRVILFWNMFFPGHILQFETRVSRSLSLTREGLGPTMNFYLSEMSGFQPLQCDQQYLAMDRNGSFPRQNVALVNRPSSTHFLVWISCTSMMMVFVVFKWYVHAKFTKTSKHLGFFTQIICHCTGSSISPKVAPPLGSKSSGSKWSSESWSSCSSWSS